MEVSIYLGIFLLIFIWVLLGIKWAIIHNVEDTRDYKWYSILIGGPDWWIGYIIDTIADLIKKSKPVKKNNE